MAEKIPSGSEYIGTAKKEIEVWENKGPGFIAGVGNAILKPVEFTLGKMIPKGMPDSVAKAIASSLQGLDKLVSFTVDRQKILAEYKKRSKAQKSLDGKLKIADDMAREAWGWHVSYAVIQGAANGALGWAGLVPNIPMLFGVAIRAINEIAFVYGYGADSIEEKSYILNILQTGSAGDVKAKFEFVIVLKQMEKELLKQTFKKGAAEFAAKKITPGALLAAIRQLAKTLGFQITRRKALQMIPIIGALIGASFDGVYVNDVCETAFMSYRRRFIEQWQNQKKPKRKAVKKTLKAKIK